MEPQSEKEKMLWKAAKKRVAFRRHLFTYIVINGFFWAIWFFDGGKNYGGGPLPWPVWTMLGWGIGLAFNFYNAYIDNKVDAVEREYEKLKNSGK